MRNTNHRGKDLEVCAGEKLTESVRHFEKALITEKGAGLSKRDGSRKESVGMPGPYPANFKL